MDKLHAVILTPDGDEAQRRAWRRQCLRHCEARGYEVVGTASEWKDAAVMLLEGRAEVIVAAEREHFPPDRVPRVETAGQPPHMPGPPRQRRPKDVGHHS